MALGHDIGVKRAKVYWVINYCKKYMLPSNNSRDSCARQLNYRGETDIGKTLQSRDDFTRP